MCCVVMMEEEGNAGGDDKPAEDVVDWRGIAFGLARFARHRPECHQHPFDRPCHCGYEEVWEEYKRREREYYLASLGPGPTGMMAVASPGKGVKEKCCRVARGKKEKARAGRGT